MASLVIVVGSAVASYFSPEGEKPASGRDAVLAELVAEVARAKLVRAEKAEKAEKAIELMRELAFGLSDDSSFIEAFEGGLMPFGPALPPPRVQSDSLSLRASKAAKNLFSSLQNWVRSTRVAQGIKNRIITPVSNKWNGLSDRNKKIAKAVPSIFAIAITATVGYRKRAAIKAAASGLAGRVKSLRMPRMLKISMPKISNPFARA